MRLVPGRGRLDGHVNDDSGGKCQHVTKSHLRFMRVPIGRYLGVVYWSQSWFAYARARGYSPWWHLYRMSYGGVTLRLGKLTFALVPLRLT